ncbi:hypothetical protein DYB26_014905, partial [Aphanomyces astaci]
GLLNCGENNTAISAAYDSDGLVFGVYTGDSLVRMYDARNYNDGRFLSFVDTIIDVVLFLHHPDQQHILLNTNAGLLVQLDAFEGKLVRSIVVHLLAAQVATSSHAEESTSTSTSTDVNATIPLVRQPSGPETLGKSVFNMLYTELHNACQEDVGPQHYCYQICSLLHSVSGAAICRQHLSSGRWLGLLLQLVERADDVYMGADSSRNASQLVGFFLDLLGRLVPPPPSSLPDHGISVPEKPTLKLHHGCGVEVVLLLRSLLLASEWAPLLQSVFLQALSPDSTGTIW